MNNSRVRAKSVSSALANLSKSNTLRRSHSSTIGILPRSLRIVVLGLGGVGKTAMIVRFVTKRFIGDYDPTLETIYRHTTLVDDQLVNFEVMDTAGQGEKSLLLEDKCKWGESFIFVYDVTDRYSFDELLRLKFIAAYTHARLRVNFTPCWVLIGNKSDLAERERMVSIDEGKALAKDLGCHIFREISAKESMSEAGNVFEDLWREFSKISPRSPSSSQRRKFSIRLQDKIPTLDSESCVACNSESSKHVNLSINASVVSSITNSLKRQSSAPTIFGMNSRFAKDFFTNDSNNNEERIDSHRNCPCIPEQNEDCELNDCEERQRRSHIRQRTRRSGISHDLTETKPAFPLFARRKGMSKSMSVENMLASTVPNSPLGTGTPLTSSSRSSSNSSLNGSTSPGIMVKINPFDRIRGYETKYHQPHSEHTTPSSEELVSFYQDHCRRQRARRADTCHNRLVATQSLPLPACKVSEVGGS